MFERTTQPDVRLAVEPIIAWQPNLFVTDGSCFVSNSTVGPALTIMALTARACEFIAREHATGGLARATAPAA